MVESEKLFLLFSRNVGALGCRQDTGWVRLGNIDNTKGLGSLKLVRKRVEDKGVIHDS